MQPATNPVPHQGRQFLSDNAAPVHPKVWDAMRAADAQDAPYDGDAVSARLDAHVTALFGRECAVLWVATGTAANCLALATMCPPYGGVVCHREAHIEADEGGAPGFYLHGAKLLLADGPSAKLTPDTVRVVIDPIRDDVHQVQPHAISVTQVSEYGCAYKPDEIAALRRLAHERDLGFHVDGARFGNAVAYLGCSPAEAIGGADALSFGFVKNGGMNAEAIVFFDTARNPDAAREARYRRKRAGHLQSKGRFLAAQIEAMLTDDLWLENARAANHAAASLAGAEDRLMHPIEANEVFLRCTAAERELLRAQGFGFYDWGADAARFVMSWDASPDAATALGEAVSRL
ncbi:L-threonine aldolase [Alteripontixanthobacter maritimus]|uniref:L-threonine aldolase n=1 Tax=Alteripontixanthobacter maritimus TaxID=2161824 RepID=A0A369Q9P2_9SPHN|nr:beta-eliminating lyase-related protein [Alteripontixanthobacter maritimus]RDC61070.1 L-threonine aldolase [Alteripontixanthobacter maritimus]